MFKLVVVNENSGGCYSKEWWCVITWWYGWLTRRYSMYDIYVWLWWQYKVKVLPSSKILSKCMNTFGNAWICFLSFSSWARYSAPDFSSLLSVPMVSSYCEQIVSEVAWLNRWTCNMKTDTQTNQLSAFTFCFHSALISTCYCCCAWAERNTLLK